MRIIIKKKSYLNLFLIFIIIIFIAFNGIESYKYFKIDNKTSLLNLGFYNNQKLIYGFSFIEQDQFGDYFCWSGIKSGMLVRIRGNKMIIPIFNAKPDINVNPIYIKVFLNEDLVYEHNQDQNGLFMIVIDLRDENIVENDYAKLEFISNEAWTPKEYNLSDDTREISFAVKMIEFKD